MTCNRKRVLAVCLLVSLGIGAVCCTTPLALRIQRVEVGSAKHPLLPSASWVSPAMLVTFTCDKALIDLASSNNVFILAEGGTGEGLSGSVFCVGLVQDDDSETLRPVSCAGETSRAAFLGVLRLDWDRHSAGGGLSQAVLSRSVSAIRFRVMAGGSFIRMGESNAVEVGLGDPRWIQK
jgi:hypothetical protein